MKHWEEKALDFIDGNLSPKARAEFTEWLAQNPERKTELDELAEMNGMLLTPSVKEQNSGEDADVFAFTNNFEKLRIRNFQFQFLRFAAMLMVGIFIGYFATRNSGDADALNALKTEVSELQSRVAISALSNQSAVARIRAVQHLANNSNDGANFYQQLLRTARRDPSTNVRYTAVEALFLFTGNTALIDDARQLLENEKSPLVQIAIVDLLVSLNREKSLQALDRLLQNTQTDSTVRTYTLELKEKYNI
jgi:hypothetical protein